MNQVITDGLDLMPPAFSDGLDVWSRRMARPAPTHGPPQPTRHLSPPTPISAIALKS
jgi:hypothetical protein